MEFIPFIITVYFLGFIALVNLWFRYYRKIIKGAIEYVGESPSQLTVVLRPNERKTIHLNGKTTIIVQGINPWLTISYKGVKQKIYKVRLINYVGDVELINESKVFTLSVTILME